jgi:amino acid permease
VALAISALRWWRGGTAFAVVLAAMGTALIVAALVAPQALRTPNRLWWKFAQILGWVNVRVLLFLVFALVPTPVGFVLRVLHKDPRDSQEGTNWSAYVIRRRDARHYEHPF